MEETENAETRKTAQQAVSEAYKALFCSAPRRKEGIPESSWFSGQRASGEWVLVEGEKNG